MFGEIRMNDIKLAKLLGQNPGNNPQEDGKQLGQLTREKE